MAGSAQSAACSNDWPDWPRNCDCARCVHAQPHCVKLQRMHVHDGELRVMLDEALAGFPPMPVRALSAIAGQLPGRMLTARAAISATVTSEIAACRANSSFAQRESGNVSVGENA